MSLHTVMQPALLQLVHKVVARRFHSFFTHPRALIIPISLGEPTPQQVRPPRPLVCYIQRG
jgi:hypothetical protein